MAGNNNNNDNGDGHLRKNKPACAVCKKQRKGCVETCPLAPYFPHTKTHEFNAVHDLFGLSNVQRMLKQQDNHQQKQDIVDSLIWNAEKWKDDPIRGPHGAYMKLEHELESLKMYLYQQQQQQQQQLHAAIAFGRMNIVPQQYVEQMEGSCRYLDGIVRQQGHELRVAEELDHVAPANFHQNLMSDDHVNHHQ